MSGHSKWSTIKRQKGANDAKRGAIFTKLSREIIMAAKSGGGDPEKNANLRVVLGRAKVQGLPQENITRAIQRGTGQIAGADYEEITYEGYGPGGSAVMVECYSENRNRTVADLRHAFSRSNGSLGENGSVAWQFKHIGQITLPKAGIDEDELTLAALEAGAQDVSSDDENFYVETAIEDLHACNDGLAKSGFKTDEVSLTRVATNMATPTREDMEKLVKLLDALEELDDVKETFVNVDIPDDLFE